MRNNLLRGIQRIFENINNLFPVLYCLFFAGFFLFPTSRIISNYYYITVVLPFLGIVFCKKINIRVIFSSQIFKLCALFLVYMWITLFWAKDFEIKDILTYARRVLYMLGFIASTIYLVHAYPDFLKKLLTMLCWISAFVSVAYSIYFYLYLPNPFPQARLAGYGLLYNPIRTSSIYGISFLGCLYLLYRQSVVKYQLLYVGLLVPLFSYMLLSQSRGPIFAIVFTLFIWLAIITFRSGFRKSIFSKFGILMIFVFAITISIFLVSPEFFRLFFIERGLSYRLEIWENFFEIIKLKPFFGHGLNADTTTIMSDGQSFLHPHSVYVATAYYGGITALFIQLFLTGYAIYKSLNIENRSEQFFISTSIFFGALCIITDGNILIQHPKPFWIFFWFPIALSAAYELTGKNLNCTHV